MIGAVRMVMHAGTMKMSCHDAMAAEWMWPRPQDMSEPRMVAIPLVPYQHATRKGCSLRGEGKG
jgi:hypothetical protein